MSTCMFVRVKVEDEEIMRNLNLNNPLKNVGIEWDNFDLFTLLHLISSMRKKNMQTDIHI